MTSKLPNFRAGIHAAHGVGSTREGEARHTSWPEDANSPSEIATDLDRFHPDALAVPLAPKMLDILASDRPGQIRRRFRLRPRVAAAVAVAAAAVAAANVSVAASHDRPARAAITCQGLGGTSLRLDPRPDLHPTPGSPAAFRLADQRSTTRWLNTQPELYPTAGSPAAFRLADQRSLLGTADTCTHSARTPSAGTPLENVPSSTGTSVAVR